MFEGKKQSRKLLQIPAEKILPSPFQARIVFRDEEIARLACSIQQNGLLQPITVQKEKGGLYQLIAGERRLRACKLIGMEKIPAILAEYDPAQSASLGLLENIQRQDLNPFEQAKGMKAVIALWGCTQSEAAKRLGMAQPTLANKLRLLQLPVELQDFVIKNNLNERHARAVLRLESAAAQQDALAQMAKLEMNARMADAYVARLLTEQKPKARRVYVMKDVRIFLNSINHAIQIMTQSGIPATSSKREGEGFVEYTVRIPTTAGKK